MTRLPDDGTPSRPRPRSPWTEGDPRAREDRMLAFLAGVIVRGDTLSGQESIEDVRQAGYMAELARGRIADPHRRLDALVAECRARTAGLPVPARPRANPFQKEWGAPWHIGPHKIAVELPLHVMHCRSAPQSDVETSQ